MTRRNHLFLERHKRGLECVYCGSQSVHAACISFEEEKASLTPIERVDRLPHTVEDAQRSIAQATREHAEKDNVNHPTHYTSHPSGVECIQVTECMNFNVGSAVKYLWRCDHKHPSPIEDLKKARWYIDREIQRREKEGKK